MSTRVAASRKTGQVIEAYSEAKRALNTAAPERIVCRVKESDELESLLVSCFENGTPLSVYVNGQPGTGKTLSVNYILDSLKENYKFKKLVVNCMSIKNAQGLYKIITQEVNSKSLDTSQSLTPKRNTKDSLGKSVETCITSMKNHLVLVLDEIDQIEKNIKSTSDDLYKIFGWPFLPNSKLVLIGIANALDFTDRFLPKLELTPGSKPKIIKFLPYTKEDIIEIVKDRLKEVSCSVIEPTALIYCATKIAKSTGDIRKVLDICRRAIEIIEQEAISPNKDAELEKPTIKTVGISQMIRIFNEVDPMANSNLDKGCMPLMQKILLCTILLYNKDMKIKEITFSKLYDKFNTVCKAYSTAIDSESEFLNLCTLLQDQGLIDIKKSKDVRNYKFSLRLDEQALREKLQDETFMSDILNNKLYK